MNDLIFALVDPDGAVLSVVFDPAAAGPDDIARPPGVRVVPAPPGVEPVELLTWTYSGEVFVRPLRAKFVKFEGGQWVPDLAAAALDARERIDSLRDEKRLLPVAYQGVLFDADPASIANIQGLSARIARGDGLTAGWAGWRTFDNAMVWVDDSPADVLGHLNAISRELEDRQQAILLCAWGHKAAIAALDTVEAVLAYDITAGWPV